MNVVAPLWSVALKGSLVEVSILIEADAVALSTEVLVQISMEIISRGNPLEAFHLAMHCLHLVVRPCPSKYGEGDVQVEQQRAVFRGEGFIVRGVSRGNNGGQLVALWKFQLLDCRAAGWRVRGRRLVVQSTTAQ